MEIPDEVRDRLESLENVVGTCYGSRRRDGQPTDEECLIVLVDRKYPETQLAADQVVPATIDIDGERIPTDVQEVGDVRAQRATPPAERPDRTRRYRPAPAGVSLGHPETTAGTLGSPPLATADGEAVVVTNAHVAAPIGAADAGDDIYQPGPADGGTSDDALGTLSDFAEISREGTNTTDSALVAVDPSVVESSVLGIGEFAGFGAVDRDATYVKSGRTTGVTTGDLRGRDVRINVGGYYDDPTTFVGCDLFGPMSASGDSGSLIGIDSSDGFRATHLLFAGSDRATIAVPFDAVEAEHGELTVYED